MMRDAIVRSVHRSTQSTASPGEMLLEWVRNRLRRWPPDIAGPASVQQIEKIIAKSRVFLAVVVLLGTYLDPEEPARFHGIVYSLSAAYVVYSIGALIALRRSLPPKAWIRTCQTIDLLFPVTLIALTAGPRSPFFILLFFGMLVSAIRDGMPGTIVYGAVGFSVLLGTGAIAYLQLWPSQYWPPPIDPSVSLLHASYAAIVPLLIGYLAEGRRRLYAEQAVVGTFLRLGRSGPTLDDSMRRIFAELLHLYPAREILFAVQDGGRQRAWLWRYVGADAAGGSNNGYFPPMRLDIADWPIYFGTHPGPCWQEDVAASDPLVARHPCRSLVGCDVALGTEFYIRLLILDPAGMPLPRLRLRVLESILGQLGPPLLSEYLLARLKSRTEEQERTRIGRELHDGVTQSLLGLELEVESYRRSLPDSDANAERFRAIREQLRDSIADLRGLMGELYLSSVTQDSLATVIRQSAARLTRETGVSVQLEGLEALDVPNREIAREIGLFLHEALINVRKHSKATRVTVSYNHEDGWATLSITDNGRGFDFTGSLRGEELEHYDHLPVMLFARARCAGARLILHSRAGEGASVELVWRLDAAARATAIGTPIARDHLGSSVQVPKYLETVPSGDGLGAEVRQH